MYLCSNGHEEVCYEGYNCPACSLIEMKDDEIGDLMARVTELEGDVEALEEERAKLEDKLDENASDADKT